MFCLGAVRWSGPVTADFIIVPKAHMDVLLLCAGFPSEGIFPSLIPLHTISTSLMPSGESKYECNHGIAPIHTVIFWIAQIIWSIWSEEYQQCLSAAPSWEAPSSRNDKLWKKAESNFPGHFACQFYMKAVSTAYSELRLTFQLWWLMRACHTLTASDYVCPVIWV